MNFSLSNILAGVIFGIWGVAVLRNGKERGDLPNILMGLLLVLYSYFVDNTYLVWGVGLALSFASYRRMR